MQAIRSSFKVIQTKYKRIGKGKVRLTQSSLLLIQPIDATTNQYEFPILETDNAIKPQPEEIRLNQNDEFISYDVSYYLLADQQLANVSIPVGPGAKVGKFYLSYAPVELDIAFADIARAWDGYLSISVNKINRLEKWDLKKHNMIPRTQFKGVSSGLPYATLPSINYSKDATKAMQPMLTLSGAKKNEIKIKLTSGAIPATAVGSMTVVDRTTDGGTALLFVSTTNIALFFRGLLAQNASKFQ